MRQAEPKKMRSRAKWKWTINLPYPSLEHLVVAVMVVGLFSVNPLGRGLNQIGGSGLAKEKKDPNLPLILAADL